MIKDRKYGGSEFRHGKRFGKSSQFMEYRLTNEFVINEVVMNGETLRKTD